MSTVASQIRDIPLWNSAVTYRINQLTQYTVAGSKRIWQAIAQSTNIPPPDSTYWEEVSPSLINTVSTGPIATTYADDFIDNNTTNNSFLGFYYTASGGSAAQAASEAGHSGIRVFTVSSNSINSFSGGYLKSNVPIVSGIYLGAYDLIFEWVIRVNNLSTVANNIQVRVGLGNTDNGNIFTNGIWFEYSAANANWRVNSVKNSTYLGLQNTGVSVNTSTWYRLSLAYTYNTLTLIPTVTYYINGVQVYQNSVAANIPANTGNPYVYSVVEVKKLVGFAGNRSVSLDLFKLVLFYNG